MGSAHFTSSARDGPRRSRTKTAMSSVPARKLEVIDHPNNVVLSGQELNVGSPDGDDALKNEREVEIMGEDYLIVGAMLSRSATGTMDVPSVVRADIEDGRTLKTYLQWRKTCLQ